MKNEWPALQYIYCYGEGENKGSSLTITKRITPVCGKIFMPYNLHTTIDETHGECVIWSHEPNMINRGNLQFFDLIPKSLRWYLYKSKFSESNLWDMKSYLSKWKKRTILNLDMDETLTWLQVRAMGSFLNKFFGVSKKSNNKSLLSLYLNDIKLFTCQSSNKLIQLLASLFNTYFFRE